MELDTTKSHEVAAGGEREPGGLPTPQAAAAAADAQEAGGSASGLPEMASSPEPGAEEAGGLASLPEALLARIVAAALPPPDPDGYRPAKRTARICAALSCCRALRSSLDSLLRSAAPGQEVWRGGCRSFGTWPSLIWAPARPCTCLGHAAWKPLLRRHSRTHVPTHRPPPTRPKYLSPTPLQGLRLLCSGSEAEIVWLHCRWLPLLGAKFTYQEERCAGLVWSGQGRCGAARRHGPGWAGAGSLGLSRHRCRTRSGKNKMLLRGARPKQAAAQARPRTGPSLARLQGPGSHFWRPARGRAGGAAARRPGGAAAHAAGAYTRKLLCPGSPCPGSLRPVLDAGGHEAGLTCIAGRRAVAGSCTLRCAWRLRHESRVTHA